MEGAATHRDPHAGILRLSREDAARTPVVRGQSHSLGDKAFGLEEPRNPLLDTIRLATKRLRGVACLVASNGGATQSKAVTAASNIICFLQVSVGLTCCGAKGANLQALVGRGERGGWGMVGVRSAHHSRVL